MKSKLKYYSNNILCFVLLIGLLLLTTNLWPNPNMFFVLCLMGGFYATGVCMLLNLIYFLPIGKNKIELLIPGICSIFLLLIFIDGDFGIDFLFFLAFALLNFALGIFWYLKEQRK